MLSLLKEVSFVTRSWKPSASFKNLNGSMKYFAIRRYSCGEMVKFSNTLLSAVKLKEFIEALQYVNVLTQDI